METSQRFSPNLLNFQWSLPVEVEIKRFLHITRSHDQWVTWLGVSDTLNLNQKVYSKSNRTQQQKYLCITNWGKFVLKIGAALFYYKLGQTLGKGKFITNWGSFIITNWGKYCYKLGKNLLQIWADITNYGNY